MSVDSAAKRMGVLDVNVPSLLPAPDGTIDAGDRAQLLGLYRHADDGGGPPPPTPGTTWIHRARRRGRR